MVLEIERLKHLIPPSKRATSIVKRNTIRTAVKKPPLSSASTIASNSAPQKSTKDEYEPPVKDYIEVGVICLFYSRFSIVCHFCFMLI